MQPVDYNARQKKQTYIFFDFECTVILLLPLFTITMPNVTAGGIFFPRGHCNLVALLKQL
jgi:hypothetical protein